MSDPLLKGDKENESGAVVTGATNPLELVMLAFTCDDDDTIDFLLSSFGSSVIDVGGKDTSLDANIFLLTLWLGVILAVVELKTVV